MFTKQGVASKITLAIRCASLHLHAESNGTFYLPPPPSGTPPPRRMRILLPLHFDTTSMKLPLHFNTPASHPHTTHAKFLPAENNRQPVSPIACTPINNITNRPHNSSFLILNSLHSPSLPPPYLLLTRSLSAPFVRLRYGNEKERTKYAPCTFRDKGGG